MQNKFLKYIKYCRNIDEWYELLKTKKEVIKNVFSCMDEKNIELNDCWQMQEIYFGIYNGLTPEQIMVYVQYWLPVTEWKKIRVAIELGVPIERIKPFVKSSDDYSYCAITELKQKYFAELLCSEEKDKTEV